VTTAGRTAKVIVNPAAGGGRTRSEWPKTIVALREAGLEPDYVLTKQPGEASDLAAAAAQDGYDVVVAVGGDGTAHEVANGLLRADDPPPLGLVQTGTGRDLSRLLSLPKDYEGQARIVATATPLRIDVGRCRYAAAAGGTEERAFLLLGGAGYSARVVERSLRLKRWFGGLAYLVAAVQELATVRATPARLVLDGAAESLPIVELLVLNAPWIGGGMFAGPGGDAQDGWLETLILPDLPRWRLLNALLRIYRGSHIEQRGVRYGTTKRIRIEPEMTMPVAVDGESVGQTPAEFWIEPGALAVLANEVRKG